MQKGDFRNTEDKTSISLPYNRTRLIEEESSAETRRKRVSPMTEAQGERIIQLLEQLVANGTPGSTRFNEALDKAIGKDFDYRSGFGNPETTG